MTRTAGDVRDREIPDRAVFEDGPGGLVRIAVSSPLAAAHVHLHGAHVTDFQPAGAEPVLFLSRASRFAPGTAIRGGVPVIFPWFGARAGESSAPVHGFARTAVWEVEALDAAADGTVTVVLRLTANDATRAHWPHDFVLRHRITIGAALAMALEVENVSTRPFVFEEALHTYLAVDDVREVSITGLAGVEYVDKVDAFARKAQGAAPIRITGETDRVYLDTGAACVLDDPRMQRRIAIAKDGSASTVVWNPWVAKAASLADLDDADWSRLVCIETANAADDAVTLAPGARHVMQARVGVERREL